MAYNLDGTEDDANLTEEERKKKSAASNQTAGVTQANQVGQTSSGSSLGDLITSVTATTPNTSQTKTNTGATNPSDVTGPNTTPANPNMSGFEQTKLADTSHDTVKYNVARILQQFPNTPDGLKQALPQIQKQYPTAKIVGEKGDRIDFGDYVDPKGEKIGVVDVLAGAGEGGKAWWWGPDSANDPTGAVAGAATPGYQTYSFGAGGQGMQTIGPGSIAQYKAGNVNQFQPTDTSATSALIQQLLGKISSQAAPDTAGQKESQKELLNQLRNDQNASIDTNAAARGVSGGNPAALHAGVNDAFTGDLTKSYRDIDTQAQQTGFDNLLKSLTAAQGVEGQMGDESRANYSTGLQGTQLQEALRQAEAASGQGATGLAQSGQSLLQQWLLGQRGLDLTQRGQDIGVDQFGQNMARLKDTDWWNLILGNL